MPRGKSQLTRQVELGEGDGLERGRLCSLALVREGDADHREQPLDGCRRGGAAEVLPCHPREIREAPAM